MVDGNKLIALLAKCPCGGVTVKLDHTPDFINDCNCSLCTRLNARWGYFNTSDVYVTGATHTYVRPDRLNPVVEIHSCKTCSTTTHWCLTESHQKTTGVSDAMGVNMDIFADDDLRGVEMRFPDGAAWSGEGPYTYRKPSLILE